MLGNGFTRKKVESLTLGEKLQKLRRECRVSLPEVSEHTGIRTEYLEYLERGEYLKLPADVYIRGFVRSYADALGVDPKGLLRLYERERSIAKNLGKEPDRHPSALEKKQRSFQWFVVTPKMMIGVLIAFVVLGIATYLYQEFRQFVSEPLVAISEPAPGSEIRGNETWISGKTDRDAQVFLNGQSIVLGENGDFRERLPLQRGPNTAEIKVVNRFGKERVETISVTALYDVPAPPVLPESPPDSLLRLSTTESKPVSILVRIEGKEVYRGELAVGETKEFRCEKICTVDTTSGGGTLASWNGGEPTSLGEAPGKKIGVSFPKAPETKEEVLPPSDTPNR